MSRFILMLTRDDRTVAHAEETYAELGDVRLDYVGFKDVGLPFKRLAALTERIHEDGRSVLLEVVSTSIDAELSSVRAAVAMGVDYVLGGRHVRETADLLAGTPIRYFPFCGRTVGIPTRLEGSMDEIVAAAVTAARLPGVYGLDLLSYRFSGDAAELTRRVVEAVDVPVIAAGSIDRVQRLRAVCAAGVWGFTVGSALFEGRFAQTPTQDQVLRGQVESIAAMLG